MTTKRHTDAKPGWILREFAKIRKQMREDRAARRLESATIGKGGITVKSRGAFTSKYSTGGTAAFIGPADAAAPEEGAQIALLDEAGQLVFGTSRVPASLANPTATASVFVFADFVNLLSRAVTSQIYLDDTVVNIVGGSSGVRISHSTTGASANTFLDPSDNRIWRSTSSRRRKLDIEDAEVDPTAVLKMRGVTFRDKGQVDTDPDTQRRYVGFIAEELHDLGLTQFVDYDDEGQPDAISYDRLSVALLAVVKDQERRLSTLEKRLADKAPTKS